MLGRVELMAAGSLPSELQPDFAFSSIASVTLMERDGRCNSACGSY
ncbi:hypothetical protein RE6C_00651 [Rhodopirellula europaea 6C]|uniref:Uncharacterized protein n=1 Tax=Rhodopirellula europaea 6C TaxID=1263867 RepID=M2B161_9BACT|nr:hypothetical protein RE6C_00651 [Rhodopirellula europaea 6C]